jgi:hypothetical protein
VTSVEKISRYHSTGIMITELGKGVSPVQNMKAYTGLEVQFHLLFVSALDGSEWTTARHSHYCTRINRTLHRRIVDVFGQRKNCLDLAGRRKKDSSTVQNLTYSLLGP